MLIALAMSCKQRVSTDDAHPLLVYDDGSGATLVSEAKEWPAKRATIIAGMEGAMGKLPDRNAAEPFDLRFHDSLVTDLYTRYGITFSAAKGEPVPAYLYVPREMKQGEKIAAMLALHPTGDAGKKITDGGGKLGRAYAKELAERGYVVIAPDYPSFGDLQHHDFSADRYSSGTMQGIFNHMRCVDLLQSLEYVDRERIGVIGHSLGGHNAMFVGAFDPRLKVVVSSCGWTLMDYYDIGEAAIARYGGRLGPWAQDRYMPLLRDKYQLNGELFPFDFDGVIAAIAPRHFVSVSPLNDSNFDVEGVRKGIESARVVYDLLNASDKLQVWYPDAAHDFPAEYRLKAYRVIDEILNHSPIYDEIRNENG